MTFTKRILKSYKRKSSGCERYIRQPELLQIGGYEVKFVLFEFKSAGIEAVICTFWAMRSRWLPRSMMWPWSSTMMTSEFWTVDRRCAMTNTVRPFIKASMPDCTMASVRVSMEDVASSRIMTGGSATAARAMEMSWRWPCERPLRRRKERCHSPAAAYE